MSAQTDPTANQPATYRAKPVQAIKWHGETNCEAVFAFLGMEHPDDELDHSLIYFDDDEAHPGDWIVRTHHGFRAYTAQAFAATYEPA